MYKLIAGSCVSLLLLSSYGPACALHAADASSPATSNGPAERQPLKLLPGQIDSTREQRYPAIDTMELKSFGRSFTSDALEVRLARLELRHFGKTRPADTYFERTERLREVTADTTMEPELYRMRRSSSVNGAAHQLGLMPSGFEPPASMNEPPPVISSVPLAPVVPVAQRRGAGLMRAGKPLIRRLGTRAARRALSMYAPPEVSMALRIAGAASTVAAVLMAARRGAGRP